jgi:tetratricopeptide (TPR) repeat protein
MRMPLKKIPLLAGLAALAVLQAAIAWNARLCWIGKAVASGPEAKIRTLRRANAVYPWNDAVHFELGKVLFERAAEALKDPPERDRFFEEAVASFVRSLRLNPASPATHFHLAQTLLYMDYLSLPVPLGHFEEYKKAARLTGHNSQIYFEVGKVLLARWGSLAAGEKDFTIDILRKTLAGKSEERLLEILEAWSLETPDYGLIDRIMPEDAASLRSYARFLGERSLSPEARRSALAKAEHLDFLRAKSELDLGRREAEAFRAAEASSRYAAALDALAGIRFYQRLGGRELIDPAEFSEVRKTALCLRAMGRVEETRSLADDDGAIAAYLAAEDQVAALGEFEDFIKQRGLLGEGPAADPPLKDLPTLAFRMALDFEQSRYRDIVRTGGLLASSSIIVAPAGRPSYVRILGLIGESHLKLDSLYEAERYLRLALEIAPDDLAILLAIERCYRRLNDETRIAEVRSAIDRLVSPAAIDLGGRIVPKGGSFEIVLVTEGRSGTVELAFMPGPGGGRPLVDIFVNGRIIWEEYGDTGSAKFTVSPPPGPVSLEIEAVGEGLRLTGLSLDMPRGR